jgi:DNA polymerase I-like protein with 3'-5' exonuclease and polymerase domains
MDVELGPYRYGFAPWRCTEGRIFERFAFDTETTDIEDDRPYLIPAYVLGAACDGQRGVFITRDNLSAFLVAHRGVPFICHNAAFDLKVADIVVKPAIDIYQSVEAGCVWDTQILKRLLWLATLGHTARGESSLADCALTHLGVTLEKDRHDTSGRKVRTSFGQFMGKSPSVIPAEYLAYLAHDVMATWHLFWELHTRIRAVLRNASSVYGYVSPDWLQYAIRNFGPLTHHIQLRASIIMDVLGRNGIAIDQGRGEEKARQVQDLLDQCKERMRSRGYLAGEAGCDKAMQSILDRFHRDRPDLELSRTPGGKWSTKEEDLAALAAEDQFFADYRIYKTAEKLLSTYLRKMGRPRLHPRFGYLLETGRTYCGGGFNLQNLPKELDEQDAAATIRGCFVPGDGKVFIDCDYSQIELVTLAYALEHQLGLGAQLAHLINANNDVHRLIAAAVLQKDPADVSKAERDSVKAVSFGRPGGMGAARLQGIAKSSYGIYLELAAVEKRIQAYHQLCPELDTFLQDEVDTGRVIAQALRLTPAAYRTACGQGYDPLDPTNQAPQGWLGGMLLKVLRDPNPVTRQGQGRPYTPQEIAFLWNQAQGLPNVGLLLEPAAAVQLAGRQAGHSLWEAVRTWAGRRSVFTVTGRLRARATFCSSRNCLFQGAAADGAILGLWRVWRAGYKLVDFVHDQLVVECPADDQVWVRAAEIESHMVAGMCEIVPGMNVKVETVITRSLNKKDRDSRYLDRPPTEEITHHVPSIAVA